MCVCFFFYFATSLGLQSLLLYNHIMEMRKSKIRHYNDIAENACTLKISEVIDQNDRTSPAISFEKWLYLCTLTQTMSFAP